ncbi:hypothetical protein [Brevibacterium spongiae]|uniref:Uncharacterized protein n=1 Tax=Brevibacterium spongiae TaxID=2909672 RepID=A0ABY5SNB2_9MICO|nr:hypothetical protein [Brevibacterium spongiae]UVI36013.1 hypothetical protein L1F31_18165 [Brevibacterium spongiae]
MDDATDETQPTAAENPKDRDPEQAPPQSEETESAGDDVDTDVTNASDSTDSPDSTESTEETARWAPPVDGAPAAPSSPPSTQYPPDPPQGDASAPSAHSAPSTGYYGPGSSPYVQSPQPYSQNGGSLPPGPYPQGPYPPGPGPMPYPAVPGQSGPAPRSKFTSALAKGATWKTALIPPGIALLGGIIAAIILTMLIASLPEFSSFTEDTGFNLDGISYALPFILMALALFGSAVLHMDINAVESFNAQLNIVMSGAPLVVTVVIVGLLWWLTKLSERRDPSPNRVSTWVRIGVSTLSMTLVLFFLQLIFAARFSTFENEGTVSFSFSAITARSFFLPLLVILITSIAGRVAGHFKGTEAIGAPFLRWAVPPLLVTWIHLVVTVAVFSIVALFVLPLSMDVPGQLVPLLFINMGLILTSLTHLGGISATAQGDVGFGSESFSENLTIFSQDAPGQLWLGLLFVVVALLAATFAATVTRRPAWTVIEQDKQQWASAWKLPVAFCLAWGLLSLVAIPMRISMSGSAEAAMIFGGSGAARAGIVPLAWTFLIFAVWGGIVEVLSRTLGPRLVLTFPALARIVAGRAVHPHWGPHLGMSEPRFAFVHPGLASAAAPTAPPVAPGPGQVGPHGPSPASSQDPGQVGTQSPGLAEPQGQSGPPQHYPQAGAQAYSAPVGPSPDASPAGHHPYAFSQGPAGTQQYGSQQYDPRQAGYQSAGYQQTGYATQPYAGPAQPFDKRKAKLVAVVAGGAVLLLVAALIVVTQVNGRMFGPEATVEKYFAELSDGDAEGALKVADVDVPQESRTLLSNDILGGAKALPDDVRVEDANISGDTAEVAVSYDVGGSKGHSTLTLHKAGKKALFFDDWALKSPELLTLAVDTPGLTKVKVNGIDVDTDGSTLALPAFPGLYTIGLAEKSDLISADAVEVRAFLGDGMDMEGEDVPLLAAQPSDAFRTEVDKQVKTLLDSCAKKTVAEPDGCPFGSSRADMYDATGLTWSISSYPTVTVADDSLGSDPYSDPESSTGPNGGPAWVISSDVEGEALVTGTYDGWDDDTFEDTVSISLSGTAEIVDGKIVITVDKDPWDW